MSLLDFDRDSRCLSIRPLRYGKTAWLRVVRGLGGILPNTKQQLFAKASSKNQRIVRAPRDFK